MIGYYGLVTGLALALLMSLYVMVSQPAVAALEHARADTAEARIGPLQTEVTRLRPTPRPCYPSSYYGSC